MLFLQLAERQRKLRQERMRKLQEMQTQHPERFQRRYGAYPSYNGFPGNNQQRYGAPAGYPQPYIGGGSYGYGRPMGYGSSGFGGGGSALPLLGGLAGQSTFPIIIRCLLRHRSWTK
jgi:hypothetical protein